MDHSARPLIRMLITLGALALILRLGWIAIDRYVPPQHNPFKPLELSHPPGWATKIKLERLKNAPEACFFAIEAAGVDYTPLELEGAQPQCRLQNALTLDQSLTPYSATLSMSCPVAAALYVWERHVVHPAAERILAERVDRIETFGSYSCRRINNASFGRWSEHATGNAVDISGFRLADGRRIMVKDAFDDATPEGDFLRTVRDEACALFSATLSPDYNALHRDHLHLDMGRFSICA